MVISVRSARFSLEYCLMRDFLYSMCKMGWTPYFDDSGAELTGCGVDDFAVDW